MKRFRNFTIHGNPSDLRDLVAKLSERLPAHWQHDTEAEERLRNLAGEGTDGFAFARDADAGIPETGLVLMLNDDKLWVPNIVPRETGQISIDQYNAILVEFSRLFDALLDQQTDLRRNLTSDEVGITEWVSPEAAELLRRFSVLANMSTGSSHPNDFARWASFIIRTHKDGSELHPDNLSQWLVEALGWPNEKAEKLALEYEFSRQLLTSYDQDPS